MVITYFFFDLSTHQHCYITLGICIEDECDSIFKNHRFFLNDYSKIYIKMLIKNL